MPDKPHKCPVCKKTFATQQGVNDHARANHGNDIAACPHVCGFCKKGFATKTALRKHKSSKHYGPRGDHYKSGSFSKDRAVAMGGADDMPDGAFFAMAEELGLSPEDLI